MISPARTLRAAARVQCAVDGHDWGDGEPVGYPHVAYVRFECGRCGQTYETPAASARVVERRAS